MEFNGYCDKPGSTESNGPMMNSVKGSLKRSYNKKDCQRYKQGSEVIGSRPNSSKQEIKRLYDR